MLLISPSSLSSTLEGLMFCFPNTWLPWEEKQSGITPQIICPSAITVPAECCFIEQG